ncbi:MAG: cyclic nucleotide-binding domain-containing protein, partial [Gammaproteobacteria bacterium]
MPSDKVAMAIPIWLKNERPRDLTPREPQYFTGPTPMPVSPIMTDATVEGPQPFELLRRLELLRSLDDTTLKALVEGVEPVQLQEGQALVRQGAWDEALYVVASGTLGAVTVAPSGEEKVIERYGP